MEATSEPKAGHPRRASPAAGGRLFPSLEDVIDGMVSHERDPRDLAELERAWFAEQEVSLAAARLDGGARLKALAEFADYHANLFNMLGLSGTALAVFLAEKHGMLRADHAEFLEA